MLLRELLGHLRWSWQSKQVLAVIPLALIVVITIVDITAPGEVHLGPLLVAAPAITASFAGPLFTGVIAVLAAASLVFIGAHDHVLGTRNLQVQVISLALVSALIVAYCLLRSRDRRELVQVRTVSETAQRALLRPLPDRLGPLRVAHVYMAAEEEAQIGGDLYGFARTDSSTRLIIGDVRGKGLTAVSEAALLIGAFRETARRRASMTELTADLEESVGFSLDEPPETDHEMGEGFITASILHIPDHEPVVGMVTCGHPPPLLVHKGRVTDLRSRQPAPPLGLGGLCDTQYIVETFRFDVGDILLLYTDGVIEARSPAGDFYPLRERIAAWAEEGPDALLGHIHDDLLTHVGGRLGDDAAMIALERLSVPQMVAPEPSGHDAALAPPPVPATPSSPPIRVGRSTGRL